jgi:ABC-type dipeptide/oligopeptide/nickel transport system permease component
MPGDPRMALLHQNLDPDIRQRVVERFGLNLSIWEQYGLYLLNLFRGDWGRSFTISSNTPVVKIIFGTRLMNTVVLMASSLFLSTIIGIVIGVLAASRRNSLLDRSSIVFFLVTYSMPTFWSGLLILLYLGFYLNLIPLFGYFTSWAEHANFLEYAADYLWHMIGPMIVLTLSFIGSFFLLMRDSVLDIFTKDFMEAARAKGLSERRILYRHAMRNAMLPMISVIAVNMTYLISGATVTEQIFTWPGIGQLTIQAVVNADYPILQGIFLLLATGVIVANFAADIIYAFADPRIRYGEK